MEAVIDKGRGVGEVAIFRRSTDVEVVADERCLPDPVALAFEEGAGLL